MTFSTQSVVSDGTLSVLPLSIDYLSRSDISVYFGSAPAPSGSWAWVGTTDRTIKFTSPVGYGIKVTVKRITSVTSLYHKFTGGAQFTSKTLDESLLQTLYVAQEFSESAGVGSDDMPLPVGAQASPGTSNKYARADHIHVGTTGGSVGSVALDTFTGDGSKVAFALANTPVTKGSTQVFIDSVYQLKSVYTLAGPTITFDEAPASGAVVEVVTLTIGGGKASDTLVNETADMLATSTGGNVQGALGWLSGMVAFVQAGVGAVKRTIQDIMRERVSVLDFMTDAQRADVRSGGTLLDVRGAIQAAIDYVAALPANNRPEVYFPAGRYLILSPLVLKDNVALRGVSRDTGYTYAFSHSSEIIAGTTMSYMLDITATNHSITDLAFYGNNAADYGWYTAVPVGSSRKSAASWSNVSITLVKKSCIYLNNLGLIKARNLQLSGFSECGIDLANSGDSDFDCLYINSGNQDSASVVNAPSSAAVYGAGFRMRNASGNINVRGGKFEFLRVGLLLNNVDGVNITGVQFDTCRKSAVYIDGDSLLAGVTTEDPAGVSSVQITGCRFLGGSAGTQGPSTHVYVGKARYVTISGNGFKRAGDAARDFATDTAQGPTYGIWLNGAELCTVVGNDLYGAATTNCLRVDHTTPASAQHTIASNSMDGTEVVTAGVVRTAAVYGSALYAAGANPIAQSTAKAWVKFNGTTNPPTIISSYNVASVTGAGGTFLVTFAAPLQDANYAVNVGVRNWYGPSDAGNCGVCSASSCTVYTTAGGVLASNGEVSVTVFR